MKEIWFYFNIYIMVENWSAYAQFEKKRTKITKILQKAPLNVRGLNKEIKSINIWRVKIFSSH